MQNAISSNKPLGHKCYGSIPHLPGSKLGPADHMIEQKLADIATGVITKHNKWPFMVVVQEKLDGSCVGVARINDELIALTRRGYLASTSPFEMHHYFDKWVKINKKRFMDILANGERACGEWLMQAHGTLYNLRHEPFVLFDILKEHERLSYSDLLKRLKANMSTFVLPTIVHYDSIGLDIETVMKRIDFTSDRHGAIDPVEGAIWRIENTKTNKIQFVTKYVRPCKEVGKYLDKTIWNITPEKLFERSLECHTMQN